ncbi:hypothetical protein BJI67_14855 [Acidihalobacter aeolianus]|uniref:Sigma-54-dependent Fis family transcriptional regulator n=2 Tax=Acidihalobacter aeolianus TaxID=2792603 RepID=A0A1D8KCH8_9GAMM|nr:hypothetical protein BJI67_14855 [Acidihalobacter aeolianus]
MLLDKEGHNVTDANTGEQALAIVAEQHVDLVMLDMRLGRENGLDILSRIRARGDHPEIVIITAHGEVDEAVCAMKLGAYDYLVKPLAPDELLIRVGKILEKRAQSQELMLLREEAARRHEPYVASQSEAMREIIRRVQRIARQDMPVLITGETGAGKEVIARLIHSLSTRANKRFVAVNSCALTENLLDSELFGHVRGAFTGANTSQPGLFQEADGGTLFLDEIGDVTQSLQAKLLRALQEGEIRPVGSTKVAKVNVRVIAATNRDLWTLSETGEYRKDLLFRLGVIEIKIPPLRQRRDGIYALTDFFLARQNAKIGDEKPFEITPRARRKLYMYDWPGNVRELTSVLERSFALAEGHVIDAEDIIINQHATDTYEEPAHDMSLHEVEVAHIRRVLSLCEGNQVKASRLLGISRSTLQRKLKFLNGFDGR